MYELMPSIFQRHAAAYHEAGHGPAMARLNFTEEKFDPRREIVRELARLRLSRDKDLREIINKSQKVSVPRRRSREPREASRACDCPGCGNSALKHSTIRRFVSKGRLKASWAAHVLPRADTKRAAFCLHYLTI